MSRHAILNPQMKNLGVSKRRLDTERPDASAPLSMAMV
jgi:hypothetical protein